MQLENIGVRSQKELILLHREDPSKGFRTSHTVDWLNARGWICAHHHVSLTIPLAFFAAIPALLTPDTPYLSKRVSIRRNCSCYVQYLLSS